YYATLFGNIMVGIGFVVLFRHKASLGGVNILALYLQDKSGIRAGKFQMVVDACIVTASLWVVSLPMLLVSVLGAVILNSIIAM
ncbi:YitT family protein, partial [Klebsiella pneumoniae]|nr:YitT family protein [Klebsiella pneumoniae]